MGDYRETVSYGTRALSHDPANATLLETLLIAEVGLGDIDAAVPYAHRLEQMNAENQIAGVTLLAEAMRDEDWDEVARRQDEGVSVGSSLDEMIRAWAAIGRGRMSAAVEVFDALAAQPGTQNAALLQKAIALGYVGDYEGAAKILGGDPVVLRLNRGGVAMYAQVLSQLERNDDAVELLDTVFPETQDAELRALRADLVAGKTVPFSVVRNARGGLSQLFYEVAESLAGEADPGLVLIYSRVAQYLNPDNIGAILVSADVLEKMEDYQLAAEAYALVPRESRSYPQAQLGRGIALRRMGDVEQAMEVLSALAETHPHLSGVHAALGDTLRFERRYAEAAPHYDAAIARIDTPHPSQWSVFFSRGITRERTGRWEEAEADFRKALELSPEQPSVLNFLGYSYVEKRINLDEALGMIERAVIARPYDGYIRDSLGWVYYRLARYDEAVREMERAVELVPLDPVLNDHLGDTYWAVGRIREAEFQWSRSLSFITDE